MAMDCSDPWFVPCPLHPVPCTLHPAPCTLVPVIHQEKTKGTFTTGTVAPLFKPHAISSVEATTLKKISAFSVLSVVKK